jgi:hypothetical protein
MRSFNVKPATAIGAVFVACVVAVVTTLALAGGVISKGSGKTVDRVIARGRTGGQTFTTAASWQNVDGAKVTVKVPSGQEALVTARFSAASTCVGSSGKGGPWCSVRIMIGGAQGHPQSAEFFEFDSSNAGTEGNFSWEAHAMERFRTLGPGEHVVQVQAIPMNGATSFTLEDWALVVQRSLK